MNRRIILVALPVLILIGVGLWVFASKKIETEVIGSYESCVAAGYPVLETFPEQCRLPDGTTFTRVVENNGVPSSTPSGATQVSLDRSFAMHVGDKAILPDGTLIFLTALNDSRCRPGVQCIWQGEIGAVFMITLQGGSPQELKLGTVNNKSAALASRIFTLQSATADTATLIVSAKAAPVATSGTLSGYIHIGPTCPVERIPPDPGCGDQPYANATISMQRAGGALSTVTSDAAGNFHATLPVGTYTVSVVKTGILPTCNSEQAVVVAGQITRIDMACDSGIR